MRLPQPPTLEEVRAHIPRVSCISPETGRPLWSVMISTYNNGRYFRDALESVLAQDHGPEEMQIEVVDGGSTQHDPEPLVTQLGKGRVAFHRLARNRGPAATFNACIERSRGHWVHILHGDDLVCRGFYDRYAALMRSYPDANMIFGQTITVDENLCWRGLLGQIPPPGGGPVPDLPVRLATAQQMQFPGVVVRRRAYEEVGGFCSLFTHACDWEMWFRVAQLGSTVCTERPYAMYRFSGESDTSRQVVFAHNIRESYLVTRLNLARIGGAPALPGVDGWRRELADRALRIAYQQDEKNCLVGRLNQARWAWLLDPTPSRLYMLGASWLKYWLAAPHRGGWRGKVASGSVS